MRYAIFDFTTHERGAELPRNLCAAVVKHDTQCIIAQATTVEDEMYLGTDWQCDHCLPPTECIHCNPLHRNAHTAHCTTCHPDPCSLAETWHTADGVCLKCNPQLGKEKLVCDSS